MLKFTTDAVTPILLKEEELKRMFEMTQNGATQHLGDGYGVSKLLERINTVGMPFMLIGLPGKSYIVANLQLVVNVPPGKLIQDLNSMRAPSIGEMGPTSPIIPKL
jgi:hypothetical protein